MISVPDAAKDVKPEHIGVATITLSCASVYMFMFIQLHRYRTYLTFVD